MEPGFFQEGLGKQLLSCNAQEAHEQTGLCSTQKEKKNDSVFLFSNKLLQVGFITTILGHAATQCPQALQCHQSHALLRGVRRGLPHPQPPVPHWGSTPGPSLCPPSSVQSKDGSCSESCTDNKKNGWREIQRGGKKKLQQNPLTQ